MKGLQIVVCVKWKSDLFSFGNMFAQIKFEQLLWKKEMGEDLQQAQLIWSHTTWVNYHNFREGSHFSSPVVEIY